jgi:hypothetical protein
VRFAAYGCKGAAHWMPAKLCAREQVMSRATLTLRRNRELVRGYSSMLPVVTAKDWQDIDFAVKHKARALHPHTSTALHPVLPQMPHVHTTPQSDMARCHIARHAMYIRHLMCCNPRARHVCRSTSSRSRSFATTTFSRTCARTSTRSSSATRRTTRSTSARRWRRTSLSPRCLRSSRRATRSWSRAATSARRSQWRTCPPCSARSCSAAARCGAAELDVGGADMLASC